MGKAGSKPEPYAGDAGEAVDVLALVLEIVGVVAERPLPIDADIGCEFADDLVAQSEAELDVVEGDADAAAAELAEVDIGLERWLQDELFG